MGDLTENIYLNARAADQAEGIAFAAPAIAGAFFVPR